MIPYRLLTLSGSILSLVAYGLGLWSEAARNAAGLGFNERFGVGRLAEGFGKVTWHEFAKRFVGLLICSLGAAVLPGCKAAEPAMTFEKGAQVILFKSNTQSVPTNRKLTKVVDLSGDQVAMMNNLIIGADRKKIGFVSPRYFVKSGKRVVGVVISSTGDFIGFDVTTEDASSVPATTTHTILVPKGKEEAATFVAEIKKIATE